MPVLDNPQYERFAQARANGAMPSDAYEIAGFKRHSGNAHRLSVNKSIIARINEILAKAAAKIESQPIVDKAYVLRRAQQLHERTTDAEEYNASARFLEMCGRHVDVQAFKDTSDVNVHITVDSAISRLAQLDEPAIDGSCEVIDHDSA